MIGDGSGVSSTSAKQRNSIGYRAIAQSDYSTQLGYQSVSTGSAATLHHRTQQVISESDIGDGHGIVFCDDDGNYAAKKTHEAVVQFPNINTGVTLNDFVGVILTVSSTLDPGSSVSFTVTNSYAYTDSVFLVSVIDYSGTYGTDGFPIVNIDRSASNGQFDIVLINAHGTNLLDGAITINFMIVGAQA